MELIQLHGTLFIGMAVVFGLYMTWGIGANDVANVMGTSVGSGAITVTTAIIIAAIFEFLGAALAGGNVTQTIRKGIIDPSSIAENPEVLIFGMLAALLAAAVWLMLASMRGWPVSTTHSIVGAVVGFTIAAIGIEAVNWGKITQIVASWVVSPVLGGGDILCPDDEHPQTHPERAPALRCGKTLGAGLCVHGWLHHVPGHDVQGVEAPQYRS